MAVSKVLTIEISDSCTKLCEMGYGKKNPCIYHSIVFDNPERSVDDGFIINRAIYGSILQEQIRSAGIRCKDVVFSLASNKIMNREITIPEMKDKLISEYIENEKDDYFPMDTSNHVLTYHIIERQKEEKQIRVLVLAAPQILVKSYQALAAELDFHIVAIDYNGNSIYQWLRKSNHEKIDYYLQINERNTMFTILENGCLALQRNMNFGTYPLVQNLIDEGYYGKIEPEAALLTLVNEETLYHSFSEMASFIPDDEKEEKLHELKRRITDAIRPLIGNVARVLEYYNTVNRDAKIAKIYIGGVGAKIKGLKELLENEFNGIEFVVLSTLPGINVAKGNTLCNVRSTEFLACIGAAEKSINFLIADEKQEMGKTLIFCAASLAVVIIAAGLIVWNGVAAYHTALKERDQLNEKINELAEIEVLEEQYNEAMVAASEITEMDTSTFRHNEEWNAMLDYLETELPENTLVSSVSSNNSGLTLNISMNSKNEAAKLLMQLKKIPYFESVAINGLTEEIDSETGIVTVSFSVLCNYLGTEEEVNSENAEGGAE